MRASPQKQPRKQNAHAAVRASGSVEALHRTRKRRDQEVIDAAARVFYERGYADASVQDVADELGILKGSLYYYIETKEDLLFRLFEQLYGEVQAIIEALAAQQGLDPLERLALYVRRQVLFNLDNLPRVAVYYNDYERLSPVRRAHIEPLRRMHERYVVDLIEEAQRTGQANPDLDARLLSQFINGSLIWICRWFQPGGKASRDRVAETCAEFALGGLTGNKPRRRRR